MESHDWTAQLQRRRIVNKIMDTLKRNLPFTGYERLQELKKIAERVEHEIYIAAKSQSIYSRKICLYMLIMETRLQNPMLDSFQPNTSVPLDSTAQIENPNGGDWQEEVYQKIKAMKELYLLIELYHTRRRTTGFEETREANKHKQQLVIPMSYKKQEMMSQSMHINIGSTEMQASSSGQSSNLQNFDYMFNHLIGQQYNYADMESGDWRAQLPQDSRERIQNKILNILKRHLPFPENEGLQELMKIVVRFEEKIYNAATSQNDYLRKILLKMLTMDTTSQDPMSDLI